MARIISQWIFQNMLSSWREKKSQNMMIWENLCEIFSFFSHFLNIAAYKIIQGSTGHRISAHINKYSSSLRVLNNQYSSLHKIT